MTRKLSAKNLSYFLAAALFLSVQALFCFGTLGWLIAAILGVEGGKPAWIIGGVLAAPATVLLVKVWIIAYRAETDPANHF